MSSGRRTIRIESLPEELQRAITRVVPMLALALGKEVVHALHRNIVLRSPVGHPAVDKHPGMYRASHTPSVGEPVFQKLPNLPSSPIPGAADVDRALAPAEPGDPLFISSAAADEDREDSYSSILEGGRRQDSRGRMIGSIQAQDGIYGPSQEATEAEHATIEAAAIRHTERLI